MATRKVYLNESFEAGDSPVTLDFPTDIGGAAIKGQILNSGGGKIDLTIVDSDGVSHTAIAPAYMSYDLSTFVSVRSVTLTHSGTDSGYQVTVSSI